MLTIYKASAGSGKTYTLAYQYIKLLLGKKLEGTDSGSGKYVLNTEKYLDSERLNRRAHSHILAITFTNKATQEMKTRILKELDDLAQQLPEGVEECSAYAADLCREFGCTREELARQARRALNDILFDYGAFNVSTIDSFFQMVLRTFADEIGFQGDYRVDLDNTSMLGMAVDSLFDKLNDRNSDDYRRLGPWFENLATDMHNSESSVNPFSRSRGLYKELSTQVEKIYAEQFEAHAKEVEEYLKHSESIAAYRKHLSDTRDRYYEYARAMAEAFTNVMDAEGCAIDSRKSTITRALQATAAGLSVQSPAKPLYGGKIAEAVGHKSSIPLNGQRDNVAEWFASRRAPSDAAIDACYQWVVALYNCVFMEKFIDAVDSGLNTLMVSGHISDIMKGARSQDNMMLLDDTKSLLSSIINNDPIPFIYERLGVRLRHFLIDEFQDTSQMQWSNLSPLLAEALAYDHDSLIIGDVKQSIYSWRGAESDLLHHKVEQQPEFAGKLSLKGSAPGENSNYRSARDIVLFNNTLFHRIATELQCAGYQGIEQTPKKTDLDSFITMYDFSDDERLQKIYDLTPEELQQQHPGAVDTPQERAIYHSCMQMLRQHNEGGYRWKDIAVLCRANKDAAKVIEYIQKHFSEIPLVSDEALYIRNNESVKLIVSFLELIAKRYLVSPRNFVEQGTDVRPSEDGAESCGELQKASAETTAFVRERTSAALCYRFEYFKSIDGIDGAEGDASALAKALNYDLPTDATTQVDVSAGIAQDVEDILQQGAESLTVLVECIINKKISEEQRRRHIDYINAFVDLVNQYSLDYPATPYTFMEYWNKSGRKTTLTAGAGRDAVNVITVHKAKGLEWDCVHIPILDWALEESKVEAWFTTDRSHDAPPIIYLEAENWLNNTYPSPFSEESEPVSPFTAQYQQLCKAAIADNLNVAYVAFTRAARELHICYGVNSKGSGPAFLAAHIIGAIIKSEQPLPPLHEQLINHLDREQNFVWGQATVAREHKVTVARRPVEPEVAEVACTEVFPVHFTEMNRVFTVLEDMVTDPLQLSADGRPASWRGVDDQDSERWRLQGIDLHLILSNIERITTTDYMDRAVALSAKQLSANAPIDHYKQLIEKAFAELDGELLQRWFGSLAGRVRCEQEYYVPDGDRCFRLDRVVFCRDGQIHLVDYKFTEQERPSHKEQVRNYLHIMRNAGYDNVIAHLWYPLRGKVVKVEAD